MGKKFFLVLFLAAFLCNAAFAQQDVNGWYWLNGQPTGNTLKAIKIFNTSTMYAVGGRGTFMKSNDGGDTWSVNNQVGNPDNSSTGNLATRDLNAMWFFDSNTGIVGGATQTAPSGVATGLINRTIDGGNTWNFAQFNDTTGSVNGFYFIDSNTGYLTGGTRARFFKTTDGGLTWQDQSFSPIVPSNTYNCVFAIDTTRIFLGTSSGKICTHLPGQDSAWKLRQLPGTTSASITDIVFKDANTGYACGNANYFAYTTDGGATWTQSNAPATVGQRDMVYNGGNLYMAGSYYSIFKSTNDGVSWDTVFFYDNSNLNQPASFIIYGMDANGSDLAVVGNAGIVNITNDGGSTWRNKNYSVGGGSTVYSSMLVSPNATFDNVPSGDIWLGPNGGGDLLYSSNGGANWTTRSTAHTRSIFGIQFVDANTGYICGGFPNNGGLGIGEVSKSTDAGLTWTYLSLPATMNTSQINAISFTDVNTGYAAGFRSPFEPGLIWKTVDGGASWVSQALEGVPGGSIVSVQMLNADSGYALANTLYSTTNGGNNWVRSIDPYVTSTGWSNMRVASWDVVYLNGNGTSNLKKIIRTVDRGATWTDLTGNLLSTVTVFRTRWLNLNHGIVSGTNGYMAKTTNGGLNWTATNPGGSTTVDCAIPNKNTWYAISDRNSSYEVWRKYENLTSISLNLNVGIEGFWDGSAQVQDTVRCTLRNSSSPYAPVEQAAYRINTSGYGTFEYNTAGSGSYYLQLTHRNALETWSAAPVALTSGGSFNYDFRSAANQAYGNNQTLKSGKYCFYSGDPNQDGTVDLSDLTMIFNDAGNFVTGYVATDINGDDIADLSDLVITFNNASAFVTKIVP